MKKDKIKFDYNLAVNVVKRLKDNCSLTHFLEHLPVDVVQQLYKENHVFAIKIKITKDEYHNNKKFDDNKKDFRYMCKAKCTRSLLTYSYIYFGYSYYKYEFSLPVKQIIRNNKEA